MLTENISPGGSLSARKIELVSALIKKQKKKNTKREKKRRFKKRVESFDRVEWKRRNQAVKFEQTNEISSRVAPEMNVCRMKRNRRRRVFSRRRTTNDFGEILPNPEERSPWMRIRSYLRKGVRSPVLSSVFHMPAFLFRETRIRSEANEALPPRRRRWLPFIQRRIRGGC